MTTNNNISSNEEEQEGVQQVGEEEVSTTLRRDIETLIEEQAWGEFQERLTTEEAQRIAIPSNGWTRLHQVCAIGSTPRHIVELVANLNPEAVTMPDTRYGDTPLHLAARNSQKSAAKIKHLLACIEGGDGQEKQGVLIRNVFGGTPLHSAVNHNAVLEVLQALVAANPRILYVHTHDGIHPISALYTAYIQTIPGYMAVAKIIKGETVENAAEGHFGRFWAKVEFMATTDQQPTNEHAREHMVLHGLLQAQILVNFYKLALKWDPTLATVPSTRGDLPLHVLVERRPFRLKEKEAIEATLEAYSQAASVRNNNGDLPIFLAIRNKMPFGNGMDAILEASRSSVMQRDPETNLLPFQLAAAVGGKVAVDNTFHLLLTQPDLLSA
eukprot:scaffold310_cov168-Amphora_coffeaeformis.AAC.33